VKGSFGHSLAKSTAAAYLVTAIALDEQGSPCQPLAYEKPLSQKGTDPIQAPIFSRISASRHPYTHGYVCCGVDSDLEDEYWKAPWGVKKDSHLSPLSKGRTFSQTLREV
jgi:hypothetical protein